MTLIAIPPSTSSVADYASPNVDPFYLRAQGFRAVVRYINGDLSKGRTHWKILTPTERDRIWKAGLGLILVFEKSADRFKAGYLAGVQDGKEAQADAYNLAYEGVVLVAFDADVTSPNMKAALDYWRGFRDGCKAYKLGVYGDWDLIEAVKAESHLNWQPNASFWSSVWDALTKKFRYRGVHPYAHVLQRKGYNTPSGGIDPNDVKRTILAQTGITPPVVKPPPFDPLHGSYGLWPVNPRKATIQVGSKGQAVQYLQGVILNKAGGDITVDGVFGPQTDRRVRDLQRMFGLTVDGVVGPQTWRVVDFLAVN